MKPVRHRLHEGYSHLDSPIHRARAGFKLVAAVTLVILTASVPAPGVVQLGTVLALLVVTAASSRIPWRFLVQRVLCLGPFGLGVAVLALFQPGGLQLFALLLGKCTVCLLVMVLLANTTPLGELLRLLRRARVPALLVTTLSLMYRYLFVLVDEAGRMTRARASRTFAARPARTWQAMATVASQLFIRSSERADRIWAAMCARGWQ